VSHPLPNPSQYGHAHAEIFEATHSNGSSGGQTLGTQLSPIGDAAIYMPRASSTSTANSFAFVAVLALELAFVLIAVVIARLSPAHAVVAAASTTAVAVGGLYSRSAAVAIGKRLVGTAPHDRA
jgi:hypothetical protein